MNDLSEILKVVLPLLLGAAGTWLAGRLKPKPEQRQDETAADRASWELLRDQFAWARQEIVDLRQQVEGSQREIARLVKAQGEIERRHARVLAAYAELQAYTQRVVSYLVALLKAVSLEPSGGALIFARVAFELPDLDRVPDPLKMGENDGKRSAA